MKTPEQKAKRSGLWAMWLGITAGSYGGTFITSILLAQPLPAVLIAGALALALAVLAGLSYQAADRWRAVANDAGRR